MAPRPPNLSRRSAVIAGWSENESDARAFLGSDEDSIRASALAALGRMGALSIPDVSSALADASPLVRRRALLLLAGGWADGLTAPPPADLLLGALADADDSVVEVACFVAGECLPAEDGVVARLVEICTGHTDALCRESAVAALGAIGDPTTVAAVLTACADKATVRRRAVLALAAFDGPEVDARLLALADDVDWQVRQAAEELLAIDNGSVTPASP